MGVAQLQAVNFSNTDGVDLDEMIDQVLILAPSFGGFYRVLRNLMSRQGAKVDKKMQQEKKRTVTGTIVSQSTSATSTERRPVTPDNPDKPPQPPDPNYSGSSTQSQDEENTKGLLHIFVSSALSVLGSNFLRIKWVANKDAKVELTET
jgi:hypothetical protein